MATRNSCAIRAYDERQNHHRLGKPPALPEDSQGSTISGMVTVAASNGAPIPLTLTLSRGEREQSAPGLVVREVRRADTALSCAQRQRMLLPLPEGEGRGEGGQSVAIPLH